MSRSRKRSPEYRLRRQVRQQPRKARRLASLLADEPKEVIVTSPEVQK